MHPQPQLWKGTHKLWLCALRGHRTRAGVRQPREDGVLPYSMKSFEPADTGHMQLLAFVWKLPLPQLPLSL